MSLRKITMKDSIWTDIWDNEGTKGKSYEDEEYGWQDANGANFDGASLERCTFEECKMSSSSWEKAKLEDVIFIRVDLSKTSFKDIKAGTLTFIECDVDEVDLSGAKITKLIMSGCYGSILTENSILKNANFDKCKLSDSEFTYTVMKLSRFIDCDLSYSLFSKSDVGHSQFTNCQLVDCDMSEAVNINNYVAKPLFTSCVISPISYKNNKWTSAAASSYNQSEPIYKKETGSYTGSTYTYPWPSPPAKIAVLICSNDSEL